MADREPEIRTIFCEALELPTAAALSAYLRQACQGKPELRRRIEGLLDAHRQAGSFLAEDELGDRTVDSTLVSERPGTQIGPYKLIQQLGEGGFGVVYLADQEPMHRQVALKIIKPGMDTREVITRFEAERQALALMDHPNIAHVHDAGTTDSGRPYFAMELVPGLPITDYCDRHEMTIRDRLILFVTVCQAVQHAHHKGIIHRDLKPSNVLVAENEDLPVPKVIDFGVAKPIGGRLSGQTTATRLGQLVGTPMYMSPEQAGHNGQDVDTRSDIYSLGVLLYELLTGSPPFDKERFRQANHDEICAIIREQEPLKPSTRITTVAEAATTISAHRHTTPAQLSRTLRGELDWIVMKSLEKDRQRRYQTATALAEDVQRYLLDEPVEACPPSALYRLRKLVRRHRTAVLTTVTVSLALLLGAVLAMGQAYRATRAEKLADKQLEIAQEQGRLAKQQARLAKAQQELAEHQRQLATDMLALAVCGLEASGLQTGPDGTVFAFFTTGQVLRCDARTGMLADEFANVAEQESLIRNQRLFFGSDLTGDGQPELYILGFEMVRILDGVSGIPVKAYTKSLGRDEICIGPDGLIYDLYHGSVHRYDSRTLQFIDTFVKSTSPIRGVDANTDGGTFAFAPDGTLYAAFWGLHNVERYDGRTGALLNVFVPTDIHRLANPRAMAFGPDGNLYVVTPERVLTYSGSDGRLLNEITAASGEQFFSLFFQPTGTLCVSATDRLLRLDETSGRLEPFIRYWELTMAYLARRVSDDPDLRIALAGSELQNLLAWWLVWQRGANVKDAEIAIHMAEAAIRNSPNNGPIWHTLGTAYYRAGRWQESLVALSKSDELCGPNVYVDFCLSMAYAQLGNTVKARASYDRGCELLRNLGSQVNGDAAVHATVPTVGASRCPGTDEVLFCFREEAAELLGIGPDAE